MYDNYTQLIVEGLTRGNDLHNAFILVLKQKGGDAIYPILISREDYQNIRAAFEEKDFTSTHLMNQLANRLGMRMTGIRIMQPANGQTQAVIDFELINQVVSIATPVAEAIIATLETNANIWIKTSMFERITRHKNTEGSMALPITAMNDQLLKEALEAAVKEDNFELAAVLHEELVKRQVTQSSTSETHSENTDN